MDVNEIENICGERPLYKNSQVYNSPDWRDWNDLTVDYPVQRKLTRGECVFDLDHVSEVQKSLIPMWLKETGLKFEAWESGPEGLHIHFWTDVYGKHQKKKLVQILSKKVEEIFGVKNDLGPMGHGHIRTENSFHPKKGYQKKFLMSTINIIIPINEISADIRALLPHCDIKPFRGKNRAENGKMPKCMKYILSHQFADGRERLLFVIASWYKANGVDDKDNVALCSEWATTNSKFISQRKIWSTVKSSNGTVGCNYRHNLLEELGVDIGECKYE